MRYIRFAIGLSAGLVFWGYVDVWHNPEAFKNRLTLAHQLEPPFYNQSIGNLLGKEYQRLKGFFWSGKAKRHLLLLVLIPVCYKVMSAFFIGGLIGLFLFCANSFTFYLLIFWPMLALAFMASRFWVKMVICGLILIELGFGIPKHLKDMREFKISISKAQTLAQGRSDIAIPTEYWPWFQRGMVDNYFHIHGMYPYWKMNAQEVLKKYEIGLWIKSKTKYYWED